MLKRDYFIREVKFSEVLDIIMKEHFLHRKPPCSRAFAMFENRTGKIAGVITYGVSCSSTLNAGICGLSEKENVYELNRVWVDKSVPHNGAGYFIAKTLKQLDREIVVTYLDTARGFVGYEFQSTNFYYTGLSAVFYDYVVKGKEHLHPSTYAYKKTKADLIAIYGPNNVYRVKRSRKHRYVYFNTKSQARKKELLDKLNYPLLPYPQN